MRLPDWLLTTFDALWNLIRCKSDMFALFPVNLVSAAAAGISHFSSYFRSNTVEATLAGWHTPTIVRDRWFNRSKKFATEINLTHVISSSHQNSILLWSIDLNSRCSVMCWLVVHPIASHRSLRCDAKAASLAHHHHHHHSTIQQTGKHNA